MTTLAEGIKLWGIAICSASVIAGVINALAPNSASGRTVKYLVGIFLSITVITPFIQGFDLPKAEITASFKEYSQELSSEAIIEETTALLIKKIEKRLTNEGIYVSNSDIKIIEGHDGGLEFESIRLFIPAEHINRQNEIDSIVNELTGKAPDIVFMR